MGLEDQLDPNRFKPYYDEARYQLKYWEGQKQLAIQKLAQQLENAGMPTHLICAEIVKELEGYAAKRWIETVLDDKYKRKYEKPEIILTNGEKFEDIKKRINAHIATDNHIEDLSKKEAPSQITTAASYDEEVKSLWQERDGNIQSNVSSIDYTLNKTCGTDLITKTEHDREVNRLQATINQLNDSKNTDYTKTKEYQDQQQLIEFQKLRISELEEIETKTIQEFSFRNANEMQSQPQQSVNLTKKISEELGFASSRLAKFFMESRNCKKQMILRHDGREIVSWRVD